MAINEKDMSKVSGGTGELAPVEKKDNIPLLAPPPAIIKPIVDANQTQTQTQAQSQNKQEIANNALSNVSGGMREMKVVETKDNKFVLVPEHCQEFDSIEDANKKIEEMKECKCHCKPHPHHGFHLHHGFHPCKEGQEPTRK